MPNGFTSPITCGGPSGLRNAPFPDYSMECRPQDALEYGTDAESVVRRMMKCVVEKFHPIEA